MDPLRAHTSRCDWWGRILGALFFGTWIVGMIVMIVSTFTGSHSMGNIGIVIMFLGWGACVTVCILPRYGPCVPKWCEQNAYGMNVSV